MPVEMYFNVYIGKEGAVTYGCGYSSKARAKRVRDKDRICIGLLTRRYA